MSKSDKMVAIRKQDANEKHDLVIKTINNMKMNKEEITFTTVYKKAKVSKGYVYKTDDIRKIITECMENPIKSIRTKDSKDVIIEALKEKIKELEKENKILKNSEQYKVKFEELLKQNKELKKQLEVAYSYK